MSDVSAVREVPFVVTVVLIIVSALLFVLLVGLALYSLFGGSKDDYDWSSSDYGSSRRYSFATSSVLVNPNESARRNIK